LVQPDDDAGPSKLLLGRCGEQVARPRAETDDRKPPARPVPRDRDSGHRACCLRHDELGIDLPWPVEAFSDAE